VAVDEEKSLVCDCYLDSDDVHKFKMAGAVVNFGLFLSEEDLEQSCFSKEKLAAEFAYEAFI